MDTGIKQLVESHMAEMQRRQDMLVEGWKTHLTSIDKYMNEKYGRSMNDIERRNVAQCLENALENSGLRSAARMFEATTEDAVKFLGIQLPVIAALLPTLVLNEIASVQALDRRVGAVFYLDVAYGSTHGSVTSGDTMLNSKTGHARDNQGQRLFASTLIRGEPIIESPAAQTVVYGGVAGAILLNTTGVADPKGYTPDKVVTIRNSSGVAVADDSAAPGTIAAIAGAGYTTFAGTITSTGVLTISSTSPTIGTSNALTIDYAYQYDLPVDAYGNRTGVPDANVTMVQSIIEAVDFPIRSRYSLGAAIDLQKAHGINLESEMTKYLGGEVRFTIDHHGVDMIDDAACDVTNAASYITSWNAAINSGQEWIWKKNELNDRFEMGNVNIINKTLRAVATFIVAGNNVARVIRQLPNFKATATGKTPPTGPYKLGMLDNRAVIHDPFMGTKKVNSVSTTGSNRYIMGYKGDSFLMSGFVYSPYIPLMATPTLVTSDLMAQKGFLSSAGYKLINAGMYTAGAITGLGTQATVS
jgi:hypothetical protein